MILAATSWADASIAIAGIVFVMVVVSILVWQIFSTGRTSVSGRREGAYRKLAEQATEAQEKTAETLEQAVAELADLRRRTAELERLLKDVG
jgi:Na+-transporting methylmalonyl-CoA/oxaloacetate decarboxylase gamma subunit